MQTDTVQPPIKPTRGCDIQPGNVIKPTPETRCRVLWRFAATPCQIVGEWRIEDSRAADLPEADRVQMFEFWFIDWLSVEIEN